MGFSVACPAAQTPLYVRRPPSGPVATVRVRHGAVTASKRDLPVNLLVTKAKRQCPDQSVAARRTFCSLRLSVRTPPFHGGESGSIPLGSANALGSPYTSVT